MNSFTCKDANRKELEDVSYPKRIAEHHRRIAIAEHMLLEIAQLLSPGYWVLRVTARRHGWEERYFTAAVTNGDDNVTGEGKTIGSALAQLIYRLLEGAVFPLGGNGGAYIREEDKEKPC